MGVSAEKGVSRAAPPPLDPLELIATAQDPEKTATRIAQIKVAEEDLKKAIRAHQRAISARGTFDTIGEVLTEAQDTLENAKVEAVKLVEDAREEAAAIVADADQRRESASKSIRERQDRVRKREQNADKREEEVGALEGKIRGELAAAEATRKDAENVKTLYETRLTKLKEAMREAMR